MAKRKAIPNIAGVKDPEHRRIFEAVKEIIDVGEGVRGDPLDRKLTIRDLVDFGLAVLKNYSPGRYITPGMIDPTGAGGGISEELLNLTPPPAPTGVYTQSGVDMVFVGWVRPVLAYSYHDHANIYRSTEDNFANAVIYTQATGSLYADSVPYEVLDEQAGTYRGYYYWITFVSKAGIEGPPNDVNGTYGAPVISPTWMLDQLTNKITSSQLHADLTSRIDLIDGDAALAGSVAARLLLEAQARTSAITTKVAEEAAARGAAMAAERGVRIDAEEALALDVLALKSTVDHPSLGVTANASGLSSTTTRVGIAESALSGQASLITSLQASINALSLSPFDPGFSYEIGNKFTYNSEIYSVTALQTPPNATPPNVNYYDLEGDYSTLADATAANAQALAILDADVEIIDGVVAAQGNALTQLQTDIGTKAAASALNSLTTRVSAAEGVNTSQATSITQLDTKVDDNYSSIQQKFTTYDGIYAQWTIKTDVNGFVAGVGLMNDGVTSSFQILASNFSVRDPSDSSKVVLGTFNGAAVMDGAYMKIASIDDASIDKLTVTKLIGETADWVALNASKIIVTSLMIDDILESTNYGANTGYQINSRTGQMILNDVLARGEMRASIIRGSVIDGGVFIGGTDITIPNEADTIGGTRMLCYASGVGFSLSATHNGAAVVADVKSASYTGEGTYVLGGETIANNHVRFFPTTIYPVMSFNLPSVTKSTANGTGYVYLRVRIYNDGTIVENLTLAQFSVGRPGRDWTTKIVNINSAGFTGSFTMRGSYVAEIVVPNDTNIPPSQTMWGSGQISLAAGHAYSGNSVLKFDFYSYCKIDAVVTYGGSLTVSDNNENYI